MTDVDDLTLISISIYFVQKYNDTGNSNDTWTEQMQLCPEHGIIVSVEGEREMLLSN